MHDSSKFARFTTADVPLIDVFVSSAAPLAFGLCALAMVVAVLSGER
jgi:hypothetical protein